MKPFSRAVLFTSCFIGWGVTAGCHSPTSPQATVKPDAHAASLQTVTFYVDGMV